jgi:hypothetical protein
MGGGGSEGVVLTLACAGLPSAGKSTMINALAGTRFLETGVCRTTSKPCVLSATQPLGPIGLSGLSGLSGLGCEWKCAEITSDDGVGLRVVDLPGVADAENTGTESNFTEMTLKWASECDVVVWVTDVRTCFLTTHEKLEYEKLKTTMQEVAQREGKLFQFCVVLTKCDVEVTKTGPAASTASVASVQRARGPQIKKGEIVSEHEETTVYDCILRAKRMFPDDRMIPFNAFGRILTRNDASETLKALAARLAPGAGKHNIQFDMKWATEDLHEKRQAQMLRSILWHLGPTEAECGTDRKDTKDKVDAMKAHLDEDSTAALVFAVLGVEDSAQHKKWHSAIVDAIEQYVNARHTYKGYRIASGVTTGYKHACALGALQHAPAVAAKYELEILARYDRLHSLKGEFVAAMICLCGSSCLATTRIYLLLPFNDDERVVPPRAMS